MDRMKIVCAWCLRFLRGVKNSRNVSHSICSPCSVKLVGYVAEHRPDPWEMWVDIGGEG